MSESKSDHESNEDPNSMCGILAAANQISRLHDVQINQQNTKALIDTGADLSFISNDFKLNYQSHGSKLITLADKSTSKVVGKFTGVLKLNSETLEHTFYILDTLIVPVIIGMDILSQFSLVTIRTEGQLRSLNLLMHMSSMNCESYRLLPGKNTDELKPIATPSLRFIRDKEFIYSEIQRLKREDIIQDSQSPWRAQCFVINQNEKKRLVVDYSNTINLQTFIDAYPMPRIDDLVAEVSQNKWFSKIDLKSAYHQIKLDPSDYKLTAFEACGKLFEFTKLPFGITNAVAIFQRVMTNFVEKFNIKKTYPYLEDIIIAGNSEKEHDENLKHFREAAIFANIYLNDAKCEYRVSKIAFLGYLIENNTLKPDPERLRALMEFPIPNSPKKLDRLIGFFAYYAKWIPNCSNLTKTLSNSRKLFVKKEPLPKSCIDTISTLKEALRTASLTSINHKLPIVIETDASDSAIGSSLSQEGKPVAFFS